MNERDSETLEDILQFAERAMRITGDRTFERFAGEEAVLYSVRYCVQAVGGLAAELSKEARDRIPAVPWQQIIAMRHRLAHNYRSIADLIVYNTVAEDLPLLISAIRAARGWSGSTL
jgi:uncharacterized protein with HEPN domain